MTTITSTQQPTIEARKRGCLFYVKRGLLVLVILVVGLPLTGFAFETIMQAGDAARYPAPGQLVPVDGYTMHIDCHGTGNPTVILESGAGGFSTQNAARQATLRNTTRVCTYDRAGMGWSDARPEPRTAWQIVHELHGLLTNANIDGPYVMVGPSNGGLYARAYATEYPEDVAGLVLLDPTFEGTLANTRGLPKGLWVFMGRIGFFRLFSQSICPTCSAEAAAIIGARRGYPIFWDTYDAEWQMLQDQKELRVLIQRLGQPDVFGDKPLIVISANQSQTPLEQMDAARRATYDVEEQAMRRLSSNVQYFTVMDEHGLSSHNDLVNQSILAVIDSARSGQTLSAASLRTE